MARARLLGWGGQNGIARRLDVDRGHFSRVMKGERQSDSLWARAERAIAQAERRRKRKRGA